MLKGLTHTHELESKPRPPPRQQSALREDNIDIK